MRLTACHHFLGPAFCKLLTQSATARIMLLAREHGTVYLLLSAPLPHNLQKDLKSHIFGLSYPTHCDNVYFDYVQHSYSNSYRLHCALQIARLILHYKNRISKLMQMCPTGIVRNTCTVTYNQTYTSETHETFDSFLSILNLCTKTPKNLPHGACSCSKH